MVDLTIVNVALPSMQRELHMSPGDLEWVVSAYALSLAALMPFGGALGDRYGRKWVFLAGRPSSSRGRWPAPCPPATVP
jgi:MFS family permease